MSGLMRKTFRYRAKMSTGTEVGCMHWVALCQKLYNLCLEQRIIWYRQRRKPMSYYDQAGHLPDLKTAFPEFAEVGSQVLQDVVLRVDRAYKQFFRRCGTKGRRAGFPRFRSLGRYSSFTLRQCGWKLEGRYLIIRNVGRLKLFLSRPIEGRIKTVTVKRTTTGKWFVSFFCDNVPAKVLPRSSAAVGIDVGLQHFLTDSNGDKVKNPRFFHQSERELRRRQRRLSRRKRGSNRRRRARLLVAKAHEKVVNQRQDFLHKLANLYVQSYGTICVEDLKISKMVRDKRFSKGISDVGWGLFVQLLTYKAEEAGRQLVRVDPHNTSRACSGCGALVDKDLSVRIHKCPCCGLVLCRDHNAALNILRAGQARQSLTPELSGVG